MLINEEYNKSEYDPSNDRSAENLFAELHAGGMSKQEMKYVCYYCPVNTLSFSMFLAIYFHAINFLVSVYSVLWTLF